MMRKISALFTPLLIAAVAYGQITESFAQGEKLIPVIKDTRHRIGDDAIVIRTFQYGEKNDIVFINLHDNEPTSVNGTKNLLETKGGLLIKIENKGKRNIAFRMHGQSYTFDPNRIFSRKGIDLTLWRSGNSKPAAISEIETFAEHLLQLIPRNAHCIVALHNNTDNGFSVQDYLPGNEKARDAKLRSIVAAQDADDFFLTTDSLLYSLLAVKQYNVIWQDNQQAVQDGSLSVYCGEKNIRYVNCETEHEKSGQYEKMMAILMECLAEIKKDH